MNIDAPLPPQLEQFVRDQLANGNFHTEAELIRAALAMLEDHCLSPAPLAVHYGSRMQPTGTEPYQGREDPFRVPADKAATASTAKRSPRGILADFCSNVSSDEIKEARHEMWAGLSNGEA